MRLKLRSLLTSSILLATLFLKVLPSEGSLVEPTYLGIVTDKDGVIVEYFDRYNEDSKLRYLAFDQHGKFRNEFVFDFDQKAQPRLIQVTDDGRFWFLSSEEDSEFKTIAVTISVFNKDGRLENKRRLSGVYEVEVSTSAKVYISDSSKPELKIETLDMVSGERKIFASPVIKREARLVDLGTESSVQWSIGNSGKIYFLSSRNDLGTVYAFLQDGTLIWQKEVQAEPKTSVAYLKDILVDRSENLFVLHSSWEVSSSTENEGSIIALTPNGDFRFRLSEEIDYLQHAAISQDGSIFCFSLGELINKYSSDGKLALQWYGEPPKFGESWDEMLTRRDIAKNADADSSLENILCVLLYGDYRKQLLAKEWLLNKGPAILPFLLDNVGQFGSWELNSVLQGLAGRFPEESMPLIRDAFLSGSTKVRQLLFEIEADMDPEPPDEFWKFLEQLAISNSARAEAAFDILKEKNKAAPVFANLVHSLRNPSLQEKQREQIRYQLESEFEPTFSVLAPIVEDANDSFRMEARKILIESMAQHLRSFKAEQELIGISKSAMRHLRDWNQKNDQILSDIAKVMIFAQGDLNYSKHAIEVASRDPEMVPLLIQGFVNVERKTPAAGGSYLPMILPLAIGYVHDSDHTYDIDDIGRISPRKSLMMIITMMQTEPLPSENIETLLSILSSNLDSDENSRKIITKLLEPDLFQKCYLQETYYWILQEAAESFTNDEKIKSALHDRLIPVVKQKDFPHASAAMNILSSAGAIDDPKSIISSLDSDNPSVVYQALNAISKADSSPEVQDRLALFLKDDRYALLAALALGKTGYPGALEVIVERGLKRLGFYSNIEINIKSISPYGKDGEKALLNLWNYPNETTKDMVRILLGQMKSDEALVLTKKEFEESLKQAKNAPSDAVVGSMILYGENPWPQLIGWAINNSSDCSQISFYSMPTESAILGLQQLVESLKATQDVQRAQKIIELIVNLEDNHDLSPCVFADKQIQTSPEIKELIDAHLLKQH